MTRVPPEFFRFVLSGAINTGASYVIYLAGLLVLPYLAAYTIAYAIGLGISYWLNSRFVFRMPSVGVNRRSLFALVYAVQYAANAMLLWFFVEQLEIPAQVGLLLVIMISVPLTYLVLRRVFAG